MSETTINLLVAENKRLKAEVEQLKQQPQQEPYAWAVEDETTEPELYLSREAACDDAYDGDGIYDQNTVMVIPLYARPSNVRRLSDDEKLKLVDDNFYFNNATGMWEGQASNILEVLDEMMDACNIPKEGEW